MYQKLFGIFLILLVSACMVSSASTGDRIEEREALRHEIRYEKDHALLVTSLVNPFNFAVCINRPYFESEGDFVSVYPIGAEEPLEYVGPFDASESWPVSPYYLLPPESELVSVLNLTDLYDVSPGGRYGIQMDIPAVPCSVLNFDNFDAKDIGELVAAEKMSRILFTTASTYEFTVPLRSE